MGTCADPSPSLPLLTRHIASYTAPKSPSCLCICKRSGASTRPRSAWSILRRSYPPYSVSPRHPGLLASDRSHRHVASPLAGWWADRKGTEWITVLCFASSIPWWVLITVRSSLAYFIVMFAIESTSRTPTARLPSLTAVVDFFTAAVMSPLTAELAAVSRAHVGVGCAYLFSRMRACGRCSTPRSDSDAHVYGAFNLSYGIGAAGKSAAF